MIDQRFETVPRRIFASAIDFVVLLPLSIALFYMVNPLGAVAQVFGYCVLTLSCYGYSIGFLLWRGQTPGKMLAGVRVVTLLREQPLRLRHVLLRMAVPAVASAIALIFDIKRILAGCPLPGTSWERAIDLVPAGVIALWIVADSWPMLKSDRRRALHDMVAGTVVVRLEVRSAGEEKA